jgi:hypothetical protein
MNILLAQSSPENIGYAVGVLLGVAFFLGLLVLGVVCIVKAFTNRTKGWIIAGCLSGIVLSIPLIAFLIAFVTGFQRGLHSRDSVPYSEDPAPSRDIHRKSEATQLVRGRNIAYSLRVPTTWTIKRAVQAFDTLSSYKSLYIGVIAEEANLGSPETVAEIARDKIREVGTDITLTEPAPLVLDGRSWLQFTVQCKVNKIPVSYQFYVYAGREGTFQVVGWTAQNLFGRDASRLRQVMQQFHFPE